MDSLHRDGAAWVTSIVELAERTSAGTSLSPDDAVDSAAVAWLASWSRPEATDLDHAGVRLLEVITGVTVDDAHDLDKLQPALAARPWDAANHLTLAFHRARREGAEAAWWEHLGRTLDGFRPHRNPDRLQSLGLWGHVAHLEVVFGPAVRLDRAALDWVFQLQERDGLCYPARGGGACPDLNWVNIVLSLDRRGHVDSDEVRSRFARMLAALRPLFDSTLARESFRQRPLPAWQRLSLPATAAWWTSPRAFRELRLAEPSWWHTALRAATVLAVVAYLDGVELQPTPHHLLAWSPSSTTRRLLVR